MFLIYYNAEEAEAFEKRRGDGDGNSVQASSHVLYCIFHMLPAFISQDPWLSARGKI